MVGLRVALRAKGSVAFSRRSSAGWMLESICWLSIGVGRGHPVSMSKASYRKPPTTRVLMLPHQTGAQYSAVKYSRDRKLCTMF